MTAWCDSLGESLRVEAARGMAPLIVSAISLLLCCLGGRPGQAYVTRRRSDVLEQERFDLSRNPLEI